MDFLTGNIMMPTVVDLQFGKSSSFGSSAKTHPFIVETEDFYEEMQASIVEQLTGGENELGLWAIRGEIGGVYRTVYNDTRCRYHFGVRAFIKNPLPSFFLGISKSDVLIRCQKIKMNWGELCEMLLKSLKGQRYLLVINCVWDVFVFNDLLSSFPNDNNGSRILLTVPESYVILSKVPSRDLYMLPSLTPHESWVLLQKKVFGENGCHPELWAIGTEIALKCHGLPLMIVVIAALLAKEEKTLYFWEQVAQTIISYLADRLVFTFNVDPRLRDLYLEDKKKSGEFGYINQDIKMTIDKEVKKHYDKMIGTRIPPHEVLPPDPGQPVEESPSISSIPVVEKEIVVGFDKEAEKIIERLVGPKPQLEIVSILGMPGLGKTTLARKVYDNPFIHYHFYIRGWALVSQLYTKRDLLLAILDSAFQLRDDIYKMSDQRLADLLRIRLIGSRYLVVLDDIWDNEAWHDLKKSFPDNNNGSRIVFTSRINSITECGKFNYPHCLRSLTRDESWELLQQKVFQGVNCPPVLIEIGKRITTNCMGLPLAIVVIAGILAKTEKTEHWWNKVADHVSSHIVRDKDQCMDALELSYNHLPNHLKVCFLYCGAFPENNDIPVWKLIRLWIAEGFIPNIGCKSMEDIAHDFLMDLVNRSLVSVAKTRSGGGVKACRLHDLLRELCLKKADEENFFLRIFGEEQVFSFSGPTKRHRLCINSHDFQYISFEPPTTHIHSILCFGSESEALPGRHASAICQTFTGLKVLDFSTIPISFLSEEILKLVFLRYIALQISNGSLPVSISDLRFLETLVIASRMNITVPQNVWKMMKLRHLLFTSGENFIAKPCINTKSITNLQTISQVRLSSSCKDVLERTPNLIKLVFCGPMLSDSGYVTFPDLDSLNHLETLKFLDTNTHARRPRNLQWNKFPTNLKRLTLSNTDLNWEEMRIVGLLPNLEVLKLKFHALVGEQWETTDGGFLRLKVLKIFHSNILRWVAFHPQFPRLEHLMLQRCNQLEEIPSGLGYIDTLQIIEVSDCSPSTAKSAKKIQDEQECKINEDLLRILISPPDLQLKLPLHETDEY